jgi:phosphoribosylamine--glycine ligase
MENVEVFHSGTRRVGEKLVTDGGRVLGITARADNIAEARNLAYEAVDKITFADAHYRTDIGSKALGRKDG